VAARARGGLAEQGARRVEAGLELPRPGLDALGAMALAAGDARVAAGERPADARMVEAALAARPEVDEPELAPVVLGVAALAGAVVGARVQAPPRAHALAERAVAVEAEPGVDALAGAVAREAVRAAFERGVGRRERAGGNLGGGCAGGERERARDSEAESGRPPHRPPSP
jgi:hypothetical protein